MKKRASVDAFATSQQALKKLLVSLAIVGLFVVYTLLHGRSNPTTLAASGGSDANSASGPPATGSDATPASGALYRDGTYTGGVADAQWGYVQVQTTIQGGKIADVKFLQYPNDRYRSVLINQYADPQLISEAIQAQSAQVDIISGATDSSFAFMQSLSDALGQAHA